MRDTFKVFGSIITATTLCLIAGGAPQADERKSSEIIETDFMSAPFSDDGQTSEISVSNLPDAEASLQAVPAELIGDLRPPKPPREQNRSSGRDVANSGGSSGGSSSGGSGDGGSGGLGDGGSGDGGSGDGGSGGSGDGGSGDGDSGGGGKGDKGGKGGKGGKGKK